MRRFSIDSLLAKAGQLSTQAARRIALEAAGHMQVGRMDVELPGGEKRSFGKAGAEPYGAVRVFDDSFFPRALSGGEIAIGETYMDGLWAAEDLTALLMLGILNREHAPATIRRLNDISRNASRALHLNRRNTQDGSRENVQAHYDLGNAFFQLFLDETLTYSCPVYETPDQQLAEAQRHKYRVLCEQAEIVAGDHVLEIGSGWGGFALHAARALGCKVTAITISREQLALATERVAAAGLSGQVEIRFSDYRDLEGAFDKIVSIEMFEAVGAEYFDTYFQKCDAVLKPGGRMALQTIAVPEKTFQDLYDGVNWMQKYIFPGGMLPSLESLERSVAPTNLVIAASRDIASHYPPTLREWRRRFLENIDAVRALGFDDRFIRMWEFYLCASEAGFLTGAALDLQVVLEKAG